MKAESTKIKKWLTNVTAQLPGLDKVLKEISADTLLIGAGVFDIYQELGWIPPLKRKTGDLDLSVGLVSGPKDYTAVRDSILAHGYKKSDGTHPYRYFAPKPISGALTYIDLLAHPASPKITKGEAKRTMGAGEDFSFNGFTFASKASYQITSHVYFPNPLGMWALKRAAYLDDPMRRSKDLADIIELASGLVENGTHYDLESVWDQIKNYPEATQVRQMLSALANGESSQWDIENVRQELLSRNYAGTDIDESIPQRLAEVLEILG